VLEQVRGVDGVELAAGSVGDSETTLVEPGAEQATADSDDVAGFTSIFRYFLLTFAGRSASS
jgi:hypothetical protein